MNRHTIVTHPPGKVFSVWENFTYADNSRELLRIWVFIPARGGERQFLGIVGEAAREEESDEVTPLCTMCGVPGCEGGCPPCLAP